jgi:hypothetical protein
MGKPAQVNENYNHSQTYTEYLVALQKESGPPEIVSQQMIRSLPEPEDPEPEFDVDMETTTHPEAEMTIYPVDPDEEEDDLLRKHGLI